jgi:hypothetical protein
MEFNSFLWNQLKQSELGAESIRLFENFRTFCQPDQIDVLIAAFNKSKLLKEDNEGVIIQHSVAWINACYKDVVKSAVEISRIAETQQVLETLSAWHWIDDKKNEHPFFGVDDIPKISIALYWYKPDYFFPYYFYRRTQMLKKIFDTLGIYFPPIPSKRDMKGRFLYYADLCKSVYEFRMTHGLTPSEFCSLLYFFAPNLLPEEEENRNKPKMAYFVGGGRKTSEHDASGDFDFLDEAGDDAVENWQGNAFASPGDIVVMYCLTPRSCIHSIWRVKEYGYVDPFFYFYNNTWICKPVKVPQIGISEIKSDEILSQMPLVRQNMQGINGTVIEKKYYDRILYLLSQKGFDISVLPRLDDLAFGSDLSPTNEKEVEVSLLEPLLIKLGYHQLDWVRQLKLKIGRGEKIIPDYVLLLDRKNEDYSAFWVWEAKYSIIKDQELKDAFIQAKSYAQRLTAKGFGIVSREGVWIANEIHVEQKNLQFYSWNDLNNENSFHRLQAVCRKPR